MYIWVRQLKSSYLCIQKYVPIEERFEVQDLCANVLFHNRVEGDL